MRILYVIPYAPNHIRVRPYEFIRHMAGRGHAITLLTLVSNQFDRASVEDLRRQGIEVIAYPLPAWRSLRNCARGLLTTDPLQSFYCWQPELADHLVRLAAAGDEKGRFDVIHLEHMRGARFGQHLRAHQLEFPVPLIWDSVDCISYLFSQAAQHNRKFLSRLVNRFELGRSRSYEGRMAGLFDRVLVTSKLDQKAFLELAPPAGPSPRMDVVHNGVDILYFQPGRFEARQDQTLVVSGKMSYHANIAMVLYLVETIMPLIWEKIPQVRLMVIGKDPPSEIHSLAADPRIQISGYVPDMRPYLQKATAALAPLTYGAGIQNKVLEAMACATPVVTTPRAVSALAVAPGSDLLVGQSPEEFAGHVLRLLDNTEYRRIIGDTGRRFVEQNHDWRGIAEQLECIYLDEIKRQGI